MTSRIGTAFILVASLGGGAVHAQRPAIPANYDESKVGNHPLPDPLVSQKGERVRDAETWWKLRRPEIVRLFEEDMYGRSPARADGVRFEVFDEDDHALSGKAIRKQLAIHFSDKKDGPTADMLMYLPAAAKKPVPVFLVLSFVGNHKVSPEPAIKLGASWDRQTKSKRPTPESERAKADLPELDAALARGYGIAWICYNDIEPDFLGGIDFGIRPLFFKPGQTTPAPDDWGALAAWGWGLSRALDYLETDKDVDARRVAIVGHSRLGKTVLWAGARDPRFAMVLASGSGEGGAALSRRDYGETIKHLVTNFPYWFCSNYRKYADHVADLPMDQHMLIALIAPRPVYLATAEDDRWADPKGEFLAAVAAGPVYRLLGAEGLGTDEMPPLDKPIGKAIGFHYRPGKHAVTPYEWEQYLRFADAHLRQ
ncbi:MAG TPA: acetylxylan esterase [Isosphaeraceae bacterium]|jgi:hypothetical protein|nr:acetylxylan esterase [Isosphaeraceae bacterium]